MRKRGVEFVDGTAPGFAAILGAPPTNEIAVQLAQELQEKNLYVFMCADHEGRTMSEQLVEATGIKTTRELVGHALRELLRHRDQKQILKLLGKVEWEGDLSEMRRLRTFE